MARKKNFKPPKKNPANKQPPVAGGQNDPPTPIELDGEAYYAGQNFLKALTLMKELSSRIENADPTDLLQKLQTTVFQNIATTITGLQTEQEDYMSTIDFVRGIFELSPNRNEFLVKLLREVSSYGTEYYDMVKKCEQVPGIENPIAEDITSQELISLLTKNLGDGQENFKLKEANGNEMITGARKESQTSEEQKKNIKNDIEENQKVKTQKNQDLAIFLQHFYADEQWEAKKASVTSLWKSMSLQEKKDILKVKLSDLRIFYLSHPFVFPRYFLWSCEFERKSLISFHCHRCGDIFVDKTCFKVHVVRQHMVCQKLQSFMPICIAEIWSELLRECPWEPYNATATSEVLTEKKICKDSELVEDTSSGFNEGEDSSPSYSISDYHTRKHLLTQIHKEFEFLVRHKYLSEYGLNYVIELTTKGLEGLTIGSHILSKALEKIPLRICFLDALTLKEILDFLRDISETCGIGIDLDEKSIKEDEQLKEGDNRFIFAESSIILGDYFPDSVHGDDVFLNWIYSRSSEEQFTTWSLKDNEIIKQQQIFQKLWQEDVFIMWFLETKCYCMNNKETLKSIQDLFLEEAKKRKGEFTPKSHELVLMKRKEELIKTENTIICSRFEVDFITTVLQDVQGLQLNNVDTFINKEIEKKQKHLSVKIGIIDAHIFRRISVMQQLKLELENVSSHNDEFILVSLANIYLRKHLEDLAEKGATTKKGKQSKKAKGSKVQSAEECISDLSSNKVNVENVQRSDGFGVGIRNMAGENNCFMNVIIQSLWHLSGFQEEIMRIPNHTDTHDKNLRVVCALRDTFASMSMRSSDSKSEAVDPTALRKAISDLGRGSNLFQVGQMNDASELLSVILKTLHVSLSASDSNVESIESSCTGSWECASSPCLVHHFFGMNILEQMKCSYCGMESKPLKYTSLFRNINATALRTMEASCTESSFEELLYVETKSRLTCNLVDGGCGKFDYINHYLSGPPPRVFTIVLGWQKSSESADDIAATLAALSTEIDISVLYPNLDAKNKYILISVVCYRQEKHYIVFVYHRDLECWVMYDDTLVDVIGGWTDVLTLCKEKCFQPQVLFFKASADPKPSH